ncbi:hypothetical protein EYF80_027405 [Liparis tanakae]|uniref:Uncharacterized protein n=1 Tax=Liparis tanakae TaxID=230148 RepID=A0A4Z2HBX6_9TELE|nr:hypothetical protein EYF80_027405 [Liparis tanakae]
MAPEVMLFVWGSGVVPISVKKALLGLIPTRRRTQGSSPQRRPGQPPPLDRTLSSFVRSYLPRDISQAVGESVRVNRGEECLAMPQQSLLLHSCGQTQSRPADSAEPPSFFGSPPAAMRLARLIWPSALIRRKIIIPASADKRAQSSVLMPELLFDPDRNSRAR